MPLIANKRARECSLTPKRDYLLDGNGNIYNANNCYGFFVSWGLNISIDIERRKFVQLWKKNNLPTSQCVTNDTLEPTPKKRWNVAAEMMRSEFASHRQDGSLVLVTRLANDKYRITRQFYRDGDVRFKKTNTLIFAPYDADGPFLFSDPTENPEVVGFINNAYSHALTHIAGDEARKCVVDCMVNHGFAAIEVLKGGSYYIDCKHTSLILKLQGFLSRLGIVLGIKPAIKSNGGEINTFAFLRDIMQYQVERSFRIKSAYYRRALTRDRINNSLIGKYINNLQDIKKTYKYYTKKYDLTVAYKIIISDINEIISQLESRLTNNLTIADITGDEK
jgi:hypothetical protein